MPISSPSICQCFHQHHQGYSFTSLHFCPNHFLLQQWRIPKQFTTGQVVQILKRAVADWLQRQQKMITLNIANQNKKGFPHLGNQVFTSIACNQWMSDRTSACFVKGFWNPQAPLGPKTHLDDGIVKTPFPGLHLIIIILLLVLANMNDGKGLVF